MKITVLVSRFQVKPSKLKLYSNLKMDGTEEERQEILDLTLDLDSWMYSLQMLDTWRFPDMLQAINATFFRIQYWIEKADGKDLKEAYKVKVAKDNRELNNEPFRIGPPDEETLKHVNKMVEKLRTICFVVTVK